MANGELYKAVCRSLVFGEECFNVFWYRQITADTGSVNIAQLLAEELQVWWNERLAVLMSEDASFEDVFVYNYSNSTEVGTMVEVDPGLIAQESAPSQWCVGWKMGRGGVGWNYPRKRVSGFPLSAYVGNGVESSLGLTLADVADDIRVLTLAGATLNWIVIRPGTGFALDNPVVTAERTVGTTISVYDASQKTRKN